MLSLRSAKNLVLETSRLFSHVLGICFSLFLDLRKYRMSVQLRHPPGRSKIKKMFSEAACSLWLACALDVYKVTSNLSTVVSAITTISLPDFQTRRSFCHEQERRVQNTGTQCHGPRLRFGRDYLKDGVRWLMTVLSSKNLEAYTLRGYFSDQNTPSGNT